MGISRELEIIMRRPGGLVLLLAFIGYSKCQVSIEGDCRYACDQDGSCKTDWNGSFRPGGTSASCFSPQFGGSFFGKVDGCKDCNQVCVGGSSSSSGSSSGGSKSDGDCRYQCQSNGGCQVFSSLGSGSCFSQAFGGSCSGTPRGCQDCNKAINC